MEDLYTEVQVIAAMLRDNNGVDPLSVAGVFTAIGLQIYKSRMTEEQYNEIVDVVSNSRVEIQTFEPFRTWGKLENIVH